MTAVDPRFAAAYGSTHRLAWVCLVLGAWTIVALWLVSGATLTAGSIVGNVIAGAVVLQCGLAILGIGIRPMAIAGRGKR